VRASRTRSLHALAILAATGCAAHQREAEPAPAPVVVLEPQVSGTSALLQAVSAPSARVAWVGGHAATVLRTTDGGGTWERLAVPGAAADSLQFRDVHAVDADTAYLLAAGPGARSRIYKTNDGGATWQLQFTNADSSAFYDCFAFWSADRGVAFSDAVAGRFAVRITEDGGENWSQVPPGSFPPAQRGEGGFAASGTCVVALGDRMAWIGTGAADTARVLGTTDGGRSWWASPTPIPAGTFAGIAALAFRDSLHGVALGGPLGDSTARSDNVATTDDGGHTWRLAGRPSFPGAVYGAAVVPGQPGMVFAVGPKGLDYSRDDARTWSGLDTLAYWSVGFGSRSVGWAVGPGGRIVRIRVSPAAPSPAEPSGRR
jgi:photosystem II stability/assembly factor-like uncharacterized protein